jgi:AI-2 transport protein TqsA
VVATTLTELGGALTNAFLIILAVVFILLETPSYPAKVKAIFGRSPGSMRQLQKVLLNVRHYLAIKTVISFITGAVISIWLWGFGVDYALIWGLVAFLLNYIPNLGSIIAAIPAVLLALVQLGPGSALVAASGFVMVNVVMGNIVEPRVMGKGLGLSTLVVFLSLVFWGWILGPVGMLLSVPLTMAFKVSLEEAPTIRWLSILLGSEAAAINACEEAQKSQE